MDVMSIAVLAAVGLLMLVGLVALAVGNRGWSIGTVVAAFLVLLSSAGYLYLATRLAARDQKWARKVSDLEAQLAKVQDGQRVTADGRREDLPGEKSLTDLREERDRWQRVAATVDVWRDRYWENASYEPEAGDDARIAARIQVPRPAPAAPPPADAAAQPAVPPLLAPGAIIFVFDDATLAEGGRYLGSFMVREATPGAAGESQILSVTLVGEPHEQERQRLREPHGPVTIYDRLPVDRWVAFYRTRPPAERAAPPSVERRDDVAAEFTGVDDEDVRALVRSFIEQFEKSSPDKRGTVVPLEQVGDVMQRLTEKPELAGTVWAKVRFDKSHSFPSSSNAGSVPREFAAGTEAEFDLETAVALRDAGVVSVIEVVERRPLRDAGAEIYGTQVIPSERIPAHPEGPVYADGAVAVARRLRAEILAFETARQRLSDAIKAADAHLATTTGVAQELRDDLESWQRDVAAATSLAEDFARALERAEKERTAADGRIVALGRELAATMARLTAEIDLVAPAPAR